MLGKMQELEAFDELTGEARVKIANFNEIDKFVEGLVPDPNYLYLHVIAMGAGEYYGCNKNGDYFPERSLQMYHHTFEQNAKVFREHNNKSDSPSYGRVAKAWYNPTMHRVELVLAVDKEKAPDIVAKVERGEKPEVSMGCRVPHDVCSICGNKAAKKNEYCEHVKTELKRVYPDGRQVYMLNLQPTFFDISFVFRRADKIAFSLRKIANALGSIDHVFDWVEKIAEQDKEVPAEAVVRTLNVGMKKLLPKLEAIEPDLPAAMLDRMALKHSIPDILSTFLMNMVPMKPQEFSRIVVVHLGLPMTHYPNVLSGVLAARPNNFILGNYQPEIENLLGNFLPMRSSYGPMLADRVLLLKTAAENIEQRKTAAIDQNIIDSAFRSQLGQTYRPFMDAPFYETDKNIAVGYKQNYGTLPVMYSPEEYARRKDENAKPKLREPLNPFAVALLLGAMYAAYRGAPGMNALKVKLGDGKAIAAGAGASLATLAALNSLSAGGTDDQRVKQASSIVSKVALPFVGAHLASAHYRNKFMRGEDLNGVERFIAENPDYISVAAPFVMHYTRKKIPGFRQEAQAIYDKVKTKLASHDKIADFADTLVNASVAGIIFRGRGMSGIGGIADQVIDNALFDKAITHLGPGSQGPAVPSAPPRPH